MQLYAAFLTLHLGFQYDFISNLPPIVNSGMLIVNSFRFYSQTEACDFSFNVRIVPFHDFSPLL